MTFRIKSAVAITTSFLCFSIFSQAQPVNMNNIDPKKVVHLNSNNSSIKKIDKTKTVEVSTLSKNEMYPNLSEKQNSELSQFNITPGGLFYKYIKKGQVVKTAHPGDIASIHVEYWLGDSLIFSTTNMNTDGEPVTEMLKSPQYRGDVNEGLLMMVPGDKIEFKYFVDSLSAHAKTPLPNYLSSGDFATWTITMYDLKTQDEHKKAQEELKSEQAKIDDKIISDYIKKNKLNAIKTPSGIYIVFHEEGFDESPKKGNQVTVNYTGKLLDGTVFDSNTDPKFNHVQPFTFSLLSGQVIKGWDESISMMRKKSKATIYIPSTQAYGNKSHGPDIPANSILVFDIEVLDYK